MRMLLRILAISLAVALGILPIGLQAQVIRGPVLGYVPDAGGSAVRPLLGVPGASSLGSRLSLGEGVRLIQVSPKQDYFLALRNKNRAVVLFDLTAGTLSARPLSFPSEAGLISISPSGSAAATYDAAKRSVSAIAGLPGSPGAERTFDVSRVAGSVAAVAVSDDGTLVLVRSERTDGESSRADLTVIGDAGVTWRVPSDDAAVAFVPGRRDIVVADNLTRSVFLVTDIGRSYARLPLFTLADDVEMFSGAAMSAGGARVVVTTQSGAVAIYEVGTGQLTWLACECRPTMVEPLNGSSLFRLTEASGGEPVVVVDASPLDPRIVITPPNTAQ